MRFLRLLTFKPAITAGGVERALVDLSRVELPPPRAPRELAPPSGGTAATTKADAPRAAEPAPVAPASGTPANGDGHGANGNGHGANGNGATALTGAEVLIRAGRADRTTDTFVLDERWQGLFTEAERQAARERRATAEDR
jgi:hypothetical protein